MIRVVLIAMHPQESSILELAFRQRGYAVYVSPPSTGNYLQLLQFRPDYVLLEVPDVYHDQLALIRLLSKNERFSQTPVIAYGSSTLVTVLNDVKSAGCKDFIHRPLKLNSIFEAMKKANPQKDLEATKASIVKSREEQKKEDIARLTDHNEPASAKIDLMVKHTGRLFSFPFAIVKIMDIADSASSGAEDLAKVINGDPSLCTTILKVANSVHFASRNKEIRNAKEAIIRIGFNEVKTIAIGLELMKVLPNQDTFGFNHMDFWTYTIGRAIVMEKLGKHLRLPDQAIAFLAGLLADLVVLLLDACFPQVFQIILKKMADTSATFELSGKAVLGFYPSEFIVKLLEQWRLPADLIYAIKMQPVMLDQQEDANPNPSRLLADALFTSKILTRAGGIGHGADDMVEAVPEYILKEMRLPAGVSISFFDPILSGLEIFATFFGIDKQLLPKKNEDLTSLPKGLFIRLGKRPLDPHHLFLSQKWQFQLARNVAEFEAAIQAEPFGVAILEYASGATDAEAEAIFKKLSAVKTKEGKTLPVLAIWPTQEHLHAPDGMLVQFVTERIDLRKLSQQFELLFL